MLTKLCVMFFAVPSCLIRDISFKTFNQNNRPYSRTRHFCTRLRTDWITAMSRDRFQGANKR